jgi:hypothetical protein
LIDLTLLQTMAQVLHAQLQASQAQYLPFVRLGDADWDKLSTTTHRGSSSARHRGKRSHQYESSSVTLSEAMRTEGNVLRDNGTKLNLNNKSIGSLQDANKLKPALVARVEHVYLSMNTLLSLQGIECFHNVRVLSVSENYIRYFSEIRCLSTLTQLEMLLLDKNPVTCMPFYREYVLQLCPRLQSVDHVKVDDAERTRLRCVYADKAGAYYKTMRENELRLCVLEHARKLAIVHQGLYKLVLGRFRTLRSDHLPVLPISQSSVYSHQYSVPEHTPYTRVHNQMDVVPSKFVSAYHAAGEEYAHMMGNHVFVGDVLHRCLQGGVFRWLQIASVEEFDRVVQVNM